MGGPHSVMILPQVHLRNGVVAHGWGGGRSDRSPTPRTVYLPPRSLRGPDYILSRVRHPTHFHLVCGRSPYPSRKGGRRGFAADCPFVPPVVVVAEQSESSVTIPHVFPMGPRAVSRRGLVRSALGCPRQFKSVAQLGRSGLASRHQLV